MPLLPYKPTLNCYKPINFGKYLMSIHFGFKFDLITTGPIQYLFTARWYSWILFCYNFISFTSIFSCFFLSQNKKISVLTHVFASLQLGS